MTRLQSNLEDLVCFSHLRWNFVFQRPQHLMSRFARQRRVFFIEEPVFERGIEPYIAASHCMRSGVCVAVPHLPDDLAPGARSNQVLSALVEGFLEQNKVRHPVEWFDSPLWIESIPAHLDAAAVLYDCMGELPGSRERLSDHERRLLKTADLVFTGGISLFEASRAMHPHVHPFPSGVDVAHFMKARATRIGPKDQESIGYAGVIDHRLDYELLRRIAALRPNWQFVMIGPVARVDPSELPQAPNIHWMGIREYDELPGYYSRWNAAIVPFATNEANQFISPAMPLEYLAAGLPVVSTPIRDVVRSYGEWGLVHIASSPEEFVVQIEDAMAYHMGLKWRERADAFLQSMSWDSIWESMNSLLSATVAAKQSASGQEPQDVKVPDGEATPV